MTISTSVKYFHSAMVGAPTLNGTAGSLIAVLDACLVDGFAIKAADSLVVASAIATVAISAGHAYEVDSVVLIAGASPAPLNGEKRVLSATGTSLTFEATGVSDQTATGTIALKLAPAGWEKAFTGTNLRGYRSTDVTSTKTLLRVDDTGATNARVLGYEALSDINTGSGPYPTDAQQSGGLYWAKATDTSSSARGWTVIADSKGFYLHVNSHTTTGNAGNGGSLQTFGDIAATKSGDAYSCLITGSASDISTSVVAAAGTLNYVYLNGQSACGAYLPRSHTSLGSSLFVGRRAEGYFVVDAVSGATTAVQWPNGADNALVLTKSLVTEYMTTSVHTLRGALRGLLLCPQNAYASFGWRDKLGGQGAYAGRKLLAIKGNGGPAENAASNAGAGLVFFDITGPWG